MSDDDIADDVLRHSEDADEWEQEPVEIERRPSGNQVVSARLPTELASRLFAEARAKGLRPSDVVRAALETYFTRTAFVTVIAVQLGNRVRVLRDEPGAETLNPVVTEAPTDWFPPQIVALGG